MAAVPTGWFAHAWLTYPSDQTPEGAYLRIMSAVNRDSPEGFFAYIEEAAQHSCFTIRNYRRDSLALARAHYPKAKLEDLRSRYAPIAQAEHGADVFAIYARERRWLDRLRKDMSGVKRVEIVGERATVETARGTRYPFRKRPNGIWGLTTFTATLVAEAEKAARDHALIERASKDYQRAAGR